MELQIQSVQYKAEDILKAIMASISEGLVAVDQSGTILFMTDTFKTICYTIFSIEPEVGQQVGRLLIMPAAHKVLSTAVNNISQGLTASYTVAHNLNSVNFSFEISTYCSADSLSILIINDISEQQMVTAQNKVLRETLSSHGGKLELLLQPLRIQSRHIVRALANWSLNLTNDNYHPDDALVMLLQANQIEQTINTLLATADRLNKNITFNVQALHLDSELDRLCIELDALTQDRYQKFKLNKDIKSKQPAGTTYMLDRDMLALIIYQSHKLMVTINDMPELGIDCKLEPKSEQEDQLELCWKITGSLQPQAAYALTKRLPVNDQYHLWPKLLHPLLTKVFISFELLNTWGGCHELIADGKTISLTIQIPIQRAEQHLDIEQTGHLIVFASKARYHWLQQRLAITGLELEFADQLAEIKNRISHLGMAKSGTIALMIDPSSGLWRAHPGLSGWESLKSVLDQLKDLAASEGLNLIPIAIQQVPDLYFRDKLSEAGFQQIVSFPFDRNMAAQLRAIFSAGQSLNVSPIQLTDLDLTYLEGLAADDPDFMRAMIELFLQSAPEVIAEIDDLISHGKYQDAAAAIHKFKSNLKLMGLTNSADVATALENQYNSKQLQPNHDQLLLKLKQHIQGGIAYYRQELLKLDG